MKKTIKRKAGRVATPDFIATFPPNPRELSIYRDAYTDDDPPLQLDESECIAMKNAVVYRSTNKSLRDDASKQQQIVPIAAPAPQHVNQQQMAFMHLMQNFAAFMSGGAASSSSSAAGNLTNFQMSGRQQAPQHALPAVPGLPALPAPSPEETHQVKDTPTPPQAHGARVETTPPQAEVTPPCRRGQLSLFTPEEQAKRVQEAFEARESVKMMKRPSKSPASTPKPKAAKKAKAKASGKKHAWLGDFETITDRLCAGIPGCSKCSGATNGCAECRERIRKYKAQSMG